MHISMVSCNKCPLAVYKNKLRKRIEKTYGRIKYGKNRTCFRTISKTLIKLSRFTEQYARKKTLYIEGQIKRVSLDIH